MKAIRVHEPGGPEVLRYEDVADPSPGPEQVVVEVAAAGVNFIDVYHRTGLYPASHPFTLGVEAAGVVVAVGNQVLGLRAGDRVAFAGPPGAYGELAVVPAARVVPVPDGVELRQAAAVMLQGMTAEYLATATHPLAEGETCLVHAAAGGVGLLLCQVARMRGARVIGTVSTEAKAALAREAGADAVILYTQQDFEHEVKKLTDNRGVQVVYDSVGRNTFAKGLACLAMRGMMVLFGQSSGPVEAIDPQVLNRAGSVFLTRPSLFHYTASRAELLERAATVLGWVRDGRLRVRVDRELSLAEAATAHRELEGRRTSGKLLLVPQQRRPTPGLDSPAGS